jgi:N utilization substance protein B
MTPADDDAEEPVGRRTAPDSRHRAREVALQMLYQWHLGGARPDEVGSAYDAIEQAADERAGPKAREFADALVRGALGRQTEIDALIAQQTEHWRPSRLTTVDRQILRLAVYELLAAETPARVVINEAVELARTFSGGDATAFVNGVLDGVRRRLAADRGDASSDAVS